MPHDNEFWRYSLRVYAQPGVAELALKWQNQYGANVNILLWCSWLEAQDIALTESLLSSALAGIKDWDEGLVKALRSIRHSLGSHSFNLGSLSGAGSSAAVVNEAAEESLKRLLLAAELDAEQSLQAWLYEHLVAYLAKPESLSRHADADSNNVAVYLRRVLRVDAIVEIPAKARQWRNLSRVSDAH